jgi:hypothetical protein
VAEIARELVEAEALVGLFGGWDWIVEDEAAGAVDLLG